MANKMGKLHVTRAHENCKRKREKLEKSKKGKARKIAHTQRESVIFISFLRCVSNDTRYQFGIELNTRGGQVNAIRGRA